MTNSALVNELATLERLERSEALLQMAGRMTRMGGWSVELPGMILTWSDAVRAIHEVPPGFTPAVDKAIDYYAPESRPILSAAFGACVTDGVPFDVELEIITESGRRVWVRSMGEARRDASGAIQRVEGAFQDISDRKRFELDVLHQSQRLAAIVEVQRALATSEESTEQLFDRIASVAQQVLGADGAVFEMIDEDALVYRGVAGILTGQLGMRHYGSSLSRRAIEQNSSLRCDDTDADPRVDAAAARRRGFRSMVVAVLKTEAGPIGTLKLVASGPHRFQDADASSLDLLAESFSALMQRRLHAQQLSASEAQYRLLFAENPQPMWVVDPVTLQFLAVNQAALVHYGYGESEFLRMNLRDLGLPEDRVTLERQTAALLKPDGAREFDIRLRTKSGQARETEITFKDVHFQTRAGLLGLANDVTERTHLEREAARAARALQMLSRCNEALIRAEEEIRLLHDVCTLSVEIGAFQMAGVGYADESSGTIVPQAFAGREGGYFATIRKQEERWDDESLVHPGPATRCIRSGQPVVVSDLSAEAAFDWIQQTTARALPGVICLPLSDRTRTFGVLALYLVEVRDVPEEELVLLRELAANLSFGIVTLRARAEQRRTNAQMLRQAALIEDAPSAFFVEDLEGRILSWNRGAERIYGWDRNYAIGQRADELFRIDSDGAGDSSASLRNDGDWSGELVKSTSTGAAVTVDSRVTLLRDHDGLPEAVLVIDTDLTDRKNLERQFLRAQRLQSIGTLAGGIAHDLNNMLMPILMGATLLKRLNPDAKSLKAIENIERSARRGAELVKQVLSFARGVEGSRISVHPRLVFDEIRAITETTFPKNISVQIEVEENIGSILGDPTQISQVLLNLCVNARDAMPDGGTLSLSARSVKRATESVAGLKSRPPGPYILLQVSDTGIGMSQEVMDRIFEPFFSTKEIASSTGLGLSTSFGIVQSHGGFLNVYSEPGRGSVLSAYFPVEQQVAADVPPAELEGAPQRGDGQWILVVDDEAPILAVTKQTLESFGYRVMTAGNGEEGLRIYTEGAPKIDLVLTDMMMPVMDGPALITELEKRDPRVKLICASGLNINANLASASSSRPRNFLSKPYGAEVLLAMIHRVLHS